MHVGIILFWSMPLHALMVLALASVKSQHGQRKLLMSLPKHRPLINGRKTLRKSGDVLPGTRIRCETTQGPFEVQLKPEWAPEGTKRFADLADSGYFKGVVFFRVVSNFLTQFAHGPNQALNQKFNRERVIDDFAQPKPLMHYGSVFFAGGGKNSRGTDMCIAFCGKPDQGTCGGLGDQPWETPVGEIGEEWWGTLKKLEAGGYGDMPPWGKGPSPGDIVRDKTRTPDNPLGEFLADHFPKTDYYKSCDVIRP